MRLLQYFGFFCLVGLSAFAAPRPNVILIMVDDMGFSDLGCYGGEIQTPNIDALARSGVRFTQFYNNARCCPTRASLMTGLAPHQAGIGHMTLEPGEKPNNDRRPPAYQGHLNDQCVTLAQVAKAAGYATFMTGKWHLAGSDQVDWPLQRGFENYYGCINGATRYFFPTAPRIMYSGNTPDPTPKSTTERPFYTTDSFTDHGLQFLAGEQAGARRPFFWYLAFTAPHWPLQAHEEDIVKYRGKYDAGWDVVRAQRYQKQIELGLIDSRWKLPPRDADVPAWDALNEDRKKALAMRMTVYAAMIDRVDQNIGRVVACLKEHQLFENTLILFLSDNGACAEGGVFPGGEILDAGKRNQSHGISLGAGWANVGSTPFRLYKHYAHEGGSATPFFMHWPAGIKPQAEWYRDPGQITDIMPTLIEVTSGQYPRKIEGHDVLPNHGISLVPAFKGDSLERTQPFFIEHEDNAFVRDGSWKLVGRGVSPARGLQPEKWELYNLKEDRTELNDLSSSMPEKVQAMSAQWSEWAKQTDVFPKNQPKQD